MGALRQAFTCGATPAPRKPQSFLSEVLSLGWRVLHEEPGRQLVVGAVTQPWTANVQFRGLPPEEFASFNSPGNAKIAWTIIAEPAGPGTSVFRTETRATTTDVEMLRLVRHEAERRIVADPAKRSAADTLTATVSKS